MSTEINSTNSSDSVNLPLFDIISIAEIDGKLYFMRGGGGYIIPHAEALSFISALKKAYKSTHPAEIELFNIREEERRQQRLLPPREMGENYKQRERLATRDGWLCHYCSKLLDHDTAVIEHKLPRSKGGTDNLENLVLCCYQDNKDKGIMTYEEYLAKIGKTPQVGAE